MVINRITYGCREFLANGLILTNECSSQTKWSFTLEKGILNIVTITFIDSINSNSLEFKGFVIYDFEKDERPSVDFLMRLCNSSLQKLNEILDTHLGSLTNVEGNKIVPFEPELAHNYFSQEIGKIYD
jgi:hypothetical protein